MIDVSYRWKTGRVRTVYETFKGWDDDINHIRKFEDLPIDAQKYITYVEESLDIPIVMIGVGAGREQTIVRQNYSSKY